MIFLSYYKKININSSLQVFECATVSEMKTIVKMNHTADDDDGIIYFFLYQAAFVDEQRQISA